MNRLKKSIQTFYINRFSKKLASRYLILESDDWGTIRMKSSEVYQSLLNKGYPVALCPYTTNDSLETDADMELLLEVLTSVKDANNNPAVLTANWIAANPDFNRIRNSDFREYFYEPSIQTLQKYPDSEHVYYLQKEGLKHGVFFPQFHGREHVHIYTWMAALRDGRGPIREAFDSDMISFNSSANPGCEADLMDVYNAWNEVDMRLSMQSMEEGLNMFRSTWGYHSKTAIAPCYYWHQDHEELMKKWDVELLQGMLVQKHPILRNGQWRKRYHYTGQDNRFGQKYSVRNVMLEPSLNPGQDVVSNALKLTAKAFDSNRPAIVSTHRLNYMGRINPRNRENGLRQLQAFLTSVVKEWPDVQFIHSAGLAELLFNRELSGK